MDRNCSVLANSRWEMLLKVRASGWALLKGYRKAYWEMPEDYWIASGQFLEGIGKPLGKAQSPAVSQLETRLDCPAAICQNVSIPIPFSEAPYLYLYLLKVKGTVKIF
jgi:hypothetical protein